MFGQKLVKTNKFFTVMMHISNSTSQARKIARVVMKIRKELVIRNFPNTKQKPSKVNCNLSATSEYNATSC